MRPNLHANKLLLCYDQFFEDCDLSDEILAEANHKIDLEKVTSTSIKMEKSQLSRCRKIEKKKLTSIKLGTRKSDQCVDKSAIDLLGVKT